MSNRQSGAERPASPPRRQRACAPCTKAKARCHFEDNKVDDGCDRCRRMKIICAPQTTKSLRRPRQVKPIHTPSTTVPAEQSNGSSSLPRNATYGPHMLATGPFGINNETSSDTTASSSAPSIAKDSPPRNVITTKTIRDRCRGALEPNQDALQQYTLPILPPSRPLQPGFGLTWNQAEQAVSDFRIKFTPFFPFVAFDPDVSAEDLLSRKPLLFKAIMLAAAPLTLAKQNEIKTSILAYVGQHLLVMDERDLGLLQGLLVFIAWGEDHFYFDQKVTYLTYLAMGYAHNLALTRPPPTMQQKMMVAAYPKDAKEAMMGHTLTTVLEESHTPEELRAFLGCQFLLSINASQFGRDSVLKGDYIDRSLNSLVLPTDFGADFILDKMIRFQQIVEQISERLPSQTNTNDGTTVFTMSISNEMQSIRNQLNQLFANMAREHRQFVLFWAMHNYVLVRLYLPASTLSPPPDQTAAYQQRQCMLYCLQAAKSFFATILSIPPDGYLIRTFISFSEILFVLVAASRLLLVEIEGWDLNEARRMFDFPSTMDSLVSTLKDLVNLRVQRAADAAAEGAAIFGTRYTPDGAEDVKEDRFFKYATKLEWIKNWFETQSLGGPVVQGPGEPPTPSGPSNWAPNNQTWSPFMFGFLGDDNWNIDF
ncbi:hypothetical protein GGS26DRAFT_561496 [Hypomontagnella submonticulosa]|nr:hypothetical protein GGS26DRAFT_561496 [Hypomontagnella submonticulosa]